MDLSVKHYSSLIQFLFNFQFKFSCPELSFDLNYAFDRLKIYTVKGKFFINDPLLKYLLS